MSDIKLWYEPDFAGNETFLRIVGKENYFLARAEISDSHVPHQAIILSKDIVLGMIKFLKNELEEMK